MIVALPLTGVITMEEALAGFSDPNVVLIAALFVIGEGLVRTGVARRLGDWLNAKAGSSETRLLVLLMLTVAGLGAVMSSTAVVAIFIPVVLRICAEHRHGAEPADDAAELRGADQRHADAGRDGAEPRGQRRARPPGRARLPLLQRDAVRRAGAGPRHRLHAVRAALARGDDRRGHLRRAPAEPARLDRAVPARRAGVSGTRARRARRWSASASRSCRCARPG